MLILHTRPLSALIMVISVFLLVLFPINPNQAQTVFQEGLQLNWEKNIAYIAPTPTQKIPKLSFQDATYHYDEHFLPIYSQKIPIQQAGKLKVQITQAQYQTLDQNVLKQIPSINEQLTDDIVINAQIGYEKGQAYALIDFVPIIQDPLTTAYKGLTQFQLKVEVQPSATPLIKQNSRTYTQNSVFNQGSLYQFTINQTGIHKIDRSFLQELGLNGTISINNARIYGNGSGMLPSLAGADRYDDVAENPIKVVDQNGNGSWDDNDYILFYAEGPNQWNYDNVLQNFKHQTHLYATATSYFLTVDLGAGKRVMSDASPNTSPTQKVTSFSGRMMYEMEWANLNSSGQEWFGEKFVPNNPVTIPFTISPPLVSNEAVQLLSRTIGTSVQTNTAFQFSSNGQVLPNRATVGVSLSNSGYPDKGQARELINTFVPTNTAQVPIELLFIAGESGAEGHLDYLALTGHQQLQLTNGQLLFRDLASIGDGEITQFTIQNTNSGVEVWDVSTIDAIRRLNVNHSGNQSSFVTATDQLKEFIAFDESNLYAPTAVGRVASQNLHAPEQLDLIIVTHPNFLAAANRLADHHRTHDQMAVKVVTVQQVYNEFSGGTPDVTAIRDYMKMFYDRATTQNNPDLIVDHLLLFGDASYDYKNIEFGENNENFVPTYESLTTINTLQTYCTDDYFGFLDDTEGINISFSDHLLDIAIGRLPVRTTTEADGVVNKIIRYATQPMSLGDWRNTLTFIADDEDTNLHFNDAEAHTQYLQSDHPNYNINKIYLDAYQQVATLGSGLYPDVNTAIDNSIFNGSFIMNYVGHGGEDGWAHEQILDLGDVQSWDNQDQLPLFITATCSFSRYDNPKRYTAGEALIINPNGGAIAIMTTVRLVYASSNEILNNAFLRKLFEPVNGKMPTVGEIARLSKNNASNTGRNNRKFSLLGDPALTLAYPQYNVVTTNINQRAVPLQVDSLYQPDTLSALSQVTIEGEIMDKNGARLEDFNGIVYPTVFDKMATLKTQANDPGSLAREFQTRNKIIFKGKASVTNGQFSFSFIVPKDIALQHGSGRISYYVENGVLDGHGYTEQLVIGGVSENSSSDEEGPKIDVFMNDESFVFGGLTNDEPILLVKLKDENGINIVGNGIGHDITAILNDDNRNTFVLNEYYKADLDNYQEGEIRYPLSKLPAGQHNISIKAWDVFNNSSKAYTEFMVAESAEIALRNVLNYPNPFIDKTNFWFEHNRAGDNLTVTIQIFTMSGRLVKTIQQQMVAEGFRVDNLEWDGLDDFGSPIGKGVYVYKLTVRGSDNKSATEMEKLVILK